MAVSALYCTFIPFTPKTLQYYILNRVYGTNTIKTAPTELPPCTASCVPYLPAHNTRSSAHHDPCPDGSQCRSHKICPRDCVHGAVSVHSALHSAHLKSEVVSSSPSVNAQCSSRVF